MIDYAKVRYGEVQAESFFVPLGAAAADLCGLGGIRVLGHVLSYTYAEVGSDRRDLVLLTMTRKQFNLELRRSIPVAGILWTVLFAVFRAPVPGQSEQASVSQNQAGNTARPAAITGSWGGFILARPGVRDGIQVSFASDDDKGSDTLYCSSWGETKWPISNFRFNGVSVAFQIRDDKNEIGSFSGVLASKIIRGSYTWRGTEYPFLIARERPKENVLRRPRPQVPKPPFPYTQEKISFKAHDETLCGILLLPKGDHKHSAVVLLPGSGAFSADPEVPGKPRADVWEWILADHLARAGIASVRLNSRGTAGSTGSYENSTIWELAADACAAIDYLSGRPEIDKHHVGFVGVSEGAIVAPIAALQQPKTAFAVLLAASAIPFDQVLLEQRKVLDSLLYKRTDAEVASRASFNKRLFDLAKSEISPEEVLAEMVRYEKNSGNVRDADDLKGEVQVITMAIARSRLRYEPLPVLQRLTVPVLAMYAEKDVKVDTNANMPALQASLATAKNPDVTVKSWPDLSHSFARTRNGIVAENNDTIDPGVLDFLADWILKHSK